ncbi:hypothetical protein IX317_002209 [Fusobacterium sp. DD29]|uniref:DUF3284 domain-containing protein n=1 Tax=unclassified Fusobacterium TaxID=2648384 RepID=UPI001B8B1390|nr:MULTISPECIES: DUF3284 domain-containing protein [unclassified Fusobacterium]MBR8701395.1 hypothetical protein [Fusobacterium sp. DD45]MBR8711163.1 hypothetical protein [Fusobacterium sp. DD28]MBR8750487.1 hypothetical protein [Fusobacterium sp. DD29]MBR8751712.1 hypothetical protein [Fusobacterium sp. DD26]MBR8762733.1 hypothetical protein [Fusobacterium sp. DD25]
MKVVVQMNVSKEVFYNFLLENLRNEFNIKGKVTPGFKFEKVLSTKFNQGVNTQGEVVKLVENEDYLIKFTSPMGVNTVEYKIRELEEKKIEVTYIEKYVGDSWLKNYNHMLIEFTFLYFLKRRKKTMFRMVEEYLKNREKEKQKKQEEKND